MKKTIILSLLAISSSLVAAEAPTKKSSDFFSGVYVAPVGIIKYANLTDKPQYGAGAAVGFQLNKYVSLEGTLIGFKSPDNWGGSAIDETDVNANFDLLKAVGGKLSLYGVAGGARDWTASDWGLNIGAGLSYSPIKKVSIFGQYVYQVWKVQKQSGQIEFGFGYAF